MSKEKAGKRLESIDEIKEYVVFLNSKRNANPSTVLVSSEIHAHAYITAIKVIVAEFGNYVNLEIDLITDFDIEGYKKLHAAYEASHKLYELSVTHDASTNYKPLTAYYARRTWMFLGMSYDLNPCDIGPVRITLGHIIHVTPDDIADFRKTFTQEQWQ